MLSTIRAAILTALLAGILLFQVPAQAQLTQPSLQVGCNWFLAFGPNGQGRGNTAFPDANVYYWLAIFAENLPAGSRVRIDGRYDSARYLAFHVHDGNLMVFDAIADFLIKPQPGSLNPFVGPAQIDPQLAAGGEYTAYVQLGQPIPSQRPDNTLYRPASRLLDSPTQKRTVLSYRLYLKDGDFSMDALPQLTLERADGTSVALANTPDSASCAALMPAYQQNGAALYGSAGLVDPTVPSTLPKFRKYVGAALGAGGSAVPASTGTVGYNPQNGFLYVKTQHTIAPLLLVRGKAPQYATQPGGPLVGQVRYWSLCQNGFNSQRVFACTADREAVLDAGGFYTIVIGPDAQRPPLAQPGAGFNWLPWGSENAGDAILRYLLQDPGFTQGIDQVKTPTNPGATMGDYAPLATYCTPAVFAAYAASGPEATFAACALSRSYQAPGLSGNLGGK